MHSALRIPHSAFLFCLLPAACCLLITGCRDSASPERPQLATVRMRIGDEVFTLEIADTDSSRAKGLMKRDSMPQDHGMIFVFPDERALSFWMRDTRIPLDIVFLDAGGKVVSVHSMKPYDLSPTSSAAPAKYAIELNAGMVARTGIKPGDMLEIPDGC